MIIDVHPEFAYELACSIPYANWLHSQNKLEKVITCKGMSPFYFFCDNIEERYSQRSLDNNHNGVQHLPNNWIHHNSIATMGKPYVELTDEEKVTANGWLDYSKWTPPDYKTKYFDPNISLPEKYIVISNRYNLEHNEYPIGYLDIECLYNIFNTLTENGYSVIYKRPKNTEFATDPNELLNMNISADVEGLGVITDYELVSMYENVYLIDDIIESIGEGYNIGQLKIYSRAEGFISMGGGSSIFCSYFSKPVVIYVNTSGDIRPGYFDENSYFRKLSNADIYPIIDKKDDILLRGYRDYSKLYTTIEQTFKQVEK
jgi:hypothetical protein